MEGIKGNGWSKDWIRSLELADEAEKDSKKLKLYPLQFANCDRLEANDCVFIFDEVGTGKTISSGLMAMHYLYNNPGKRVLVITAHSIKEQFKRDWFSKMPYEKLGYDKQVEFIGNHYANLESVRNTYYGLIIVDEAQLFLTTGTKKQNALRELKSDKVVFLTATPIKSGEDDLNEFTELAEAVAGKEAVKKIKELLSGNEKQDEAWVKNVYKVNSFDETHPITRYFKDTIKNLEHKKDQENKKQSDELNDYKKEKSVRQEILLWKYKNRDACYRVLYEQIEERLKGNKDSRFIVFARTKSEELYGSVGQLGEFFEEQGYRKFDSTNKAERTYKILDGDNFKDKDEFDKFQKEKERPTVLFITYQVGEQGLNLAGFDYVINLHISRFPSNLEQRYGRIDRLNSGGHKEFEKIHMVFLLDEFENSTNKQNYYEALETYIRSLLPYFPSRNVLLTEENLKELRTVAGKEKIQRTEKEKQKRLEELAKHLEYYGEGRNCFDDLPEGEKTELRQILEKEESDKLKAHEELIKRIGALEQDAKKLLGDCVFYVDTTDGWSVKLLGHPVRFGNEISDCPKYQSYCKEFHKEVEQRNLEQKYQDKIDEYFTQCFIRNDFNSLFPFAGYRKVFETMLEEDGFKDLQEDDRKYFIENCDSIAKRLPFMCKLRQYGNYWIWKKSETKNGYLRMDGFDYVPFVRALAAWLGKETEEKQYLDYFNLTYDAEKKQIEASAFYKLAFHFTRREEALLRSGANDSDWSYCRQEYEENGVKKTENFFYRQELKMKKINSMDEEKLAELCKEKGQSLQEYVQLGNLHWEKYRYRTLFYHFFFVKGQKKKLRSLFDWNNEKYSKEYTEHLLRIKTENGYCSLEALLKTEKNVKAADYWTRGIMYNLFGFEWDKNNPPLIWGDLLPNLQEELKNEKVY